MKFDRTLQAIADGQRKNSPAGAPFLLGLSKSARCVKFQFTSKHVTAGGR